MEKSDNIVHGEWCYITYNGFHISVSPGRRYCVIIEDYGLLSKDLNEIKSRIDFYYKQKYTELFNENLKKEIK